jgi:preprotein translocase SecE subunit
MPAGIYKPHQGYYTRVMSAIAYGLLILMGVKWLADQFAAVQIGDIQPIYVQAAAAVVGFAVFGVLGYYFLGRHPRFVDFLIATEGEMKKVNWSSRREIMGSTQVVIGLTIFIAILCQLFDLGFVSLFRWIGVLHT